MPILDDIFTHGGRDEKTGIRWDAAAPPRSLRSKRKSLEEATPSETSPTTSDPPKPRPKSPTPPPASNAPTIQKAKQPPPKEEQKPLAEPTKPIKEETAPQAESAPPPPPEVVKEPFYWNTSTDPITPPKAPPPPPVKKPAAPPIQKDRGYVYESLSSLIAKSFEGYNLPAKVQEVYHRTLQFVVDDMNEQALGHLSQNLKGIKWYESVQTVSEEYRRRHKETTGSEPQIEGTVVGFFERRSGSVHMDGREGSGGGKRDRFEPEQVSGTYAHELTHAIDNGGQFSNSHEWAAAWHIEIEGNLEREPPLSEYARSAGIGKRQRGEDQITYHRRLAEGFAEFGRAIWAGNTSKKQLKQQFPMCYDYFSKLGLV